MFQGKYIIALLLLLVQLQLTSQGYLDQALSAYNNGDYQMAIEKLKLYPDIEKDGKALATKGLSNLKLNNLSAAMLDFTEAKKNGNNDPQLFLYMAMAKQHSFAFEEASFFYKEYLRFSDIDEDQKKKALIELKNCIYSEEHELKKDQVLVQSFGDEINTVYDEIIPIQSQKYGNVFYYSTNRNNRLFDGQVYFLNDKGQWENRQDLTRSFSSENNEIIQDISSDGNSLILLEQENPTLIKKYKVSSFFEGNNLVFELSEEHFKDVVDLQIVDKATIIFAGITSMGYGGYDLYITEYVAGRWLSPKNLGPEVNSAFDERSPYMSSDQQKLYFSSNRPYCYGGYDIYYCSLAQNNTRVHLVDNSINSPGNDLGFRLQSDGQMAVFYSDRKSGKGGYDVYFAYLQEHMPFSKGDSLELIYVRDEINRVERERMIEQERKIQDTLLSKISESEDKTDGKPQETIPPNIEEESEELLHTSDLVIFYQDKFDLTNFENKEKCQNILRLLLENQELSIKLISHTDYHEPGLPEFVQYNTLKRAIYISDFFTENGIQPERISIESVAANFPVSKHEFSGEKTDEFVYLNKRIEIEIINSDYQIINSFNVMEIEIPSYASDRKHELFKSIREELYYSIEIGSSERMLKNAVLRLYEDIYIRKENLNSPNKYYVGLFTQFSQALETQKLLSNSSASYAKIVAFYDGQKIEEKRMDELVSKYPDLKGYIELMQN